MAAEMVSSIGPLRQIIRSCRSLEKMSACYREFWSAVVSRFGETVNIERTCAPSAGLGYRC